MDKDHAQEQAQAQFASIQDLMKALSYAEQQDVVIYEDTEMTEADIRQRIMENALDVQVIETYEILLCWGGPAVKISGQLNKHMTPETAELQYQDWGTPWTTYSLNTKDEKLLLEYAQQYSFKNI